MLRRLFAFAVLCLLVPSLAWGQTPAKSEKKVIVGQKVEKKDGSKPSGKGANAKKNGKANNKTAGKNADNITTSQSATGVPITGAGPASTILDEAILRFIEQSRCTGATLAISKDGQLLYSRGYGWLDEAKSKNVQPDTPMRVASVSKPITAAAIRGLIRDGRLTLDTKVWDVLGLKPASDVALDPRWRQITIGQLLEHKGGWDIQALGFDPMFQAKRVARELKLDHGAGPDETVQWMLGKPLQFNPGERSSYSNFGYCVLGRVIEKLSGRPYIDYLRQQVFRPVGIDPKEIMLAYADTEKRDSLEPWYNQPLDVDVMDAHGGVVISAPVLCKFLEAYWISGEPRKPGEHGAVYTFFGSMPGTSAIAHQRADGINFACEFNGRHGDANQNRLTAELNRLIDGLGR